MNLALPERRQTIIADNATQHDNQVSDKPQRQRGTNASRHQQRHNTSRYQFSSDTDPAAKRGDERIGRAKPILLKPGVLPSLFRAAGWCVGGKIPIAVGGIVCADGDHD